MAFIRRVKVLCEVCKNPIIRKEAESEVAFKKRKTRSPECAKELKYSKPAIANKCFCGTIKSKEHAPYCSWDHRLIAMKCKRWGIEPSVSGYKQRAAHLDAAQKEIDAKYKYAP